MNPKTILDRGVRRGQPVYFQKGKKNEEGEIFDVSFMEEILWVKDAEGRTFVMDADKVSERHVYDAAGVKEREDASFN